MNQCSTRTYAAERYYSHFTVIRGGGAKTAADLLLMANAGLFFFGAVQHAGVAVGPFHKPLIVPAAIVETLCGLCLLGRNRTFG